MKTQKPNLRKHLNADALRDTLRATFGRIPDSRQDPTISLADALMAGFAVFALKDPSLLAFDQRRQEPNSNLHSLFGINHVPSDSQLRDLLDPIDPNSLRPCFTDLFRHVQRGKALDAFHFLGQTCLLSFDGTQYFSSSKIHCPLCQVKRHQNGTVSYSHQVLSAVLVHPDLAEVLPLMPEFINVQDGSQKNDCELNAAKRFFPAFRREHPSLEVIAVGDGLTANAPLIRLLEAERVGYILVAKPGDHAYLFACMQEAFVAGRASVVTFVEPTTGQVQHFRWLNQVALNESNPDVLVNFLEYWSISADGKVQSTFSWVTDVGLQEEIVWEVMRGGRARWKVENETHNTLKNQGYHCEHNYGHGKQHLSVNFVLLMLLAFLVDQVQQLSCELFRAVWAKKKTKRQLWEEMRNLFACFSFGSMRELLEAMWKGFQKEKPRLPDSS